MRLKVAEPWTNERGQAFSQGEVYDFADWRVLVREGKAFPPDRMPAHPETGETFPSREALVEHLASQLRADEREEQLKAEDVRDAQPAVRDIERDLRRVEREAGELEAELQARRKGVETLEARLAEAKAKLEAAEAAFREAQERRQERERQIEAAKGWVPEIPDLVTDAARELALQEGVDLSEVEGTGQDGKIVKADVEAEVGAGE